MRYNGKKPHHFDKIKRGRREDLDNIYFRSAWEANVARYLNFLKSKGKVIEWKYEPKTFWFEKIKRGCVSYKPDFFVVLANGATQWWEVKGYLTPRNKTALSRMAKYFPDEKIILIDRIAYQSISLWKHIIPGWEK